MRRSTAINALRSTVAVGALALATNAHAACNTANSVVTCTGATTSDQADIAVDSAPPPTVTLVVAPGATVVRGFTTQVGPNAPPFDGAIGYTNDGIVGTAAAPVNFRAFGNPASPSNSFTFNNRGTQNGAISALNFGGAITATNSGAITGGVDLRTDGPIVFSNAGTIFNSNNSIFQSTPALSLLSWRTVTIFGPNSSQSSEVGSTVTAAIGGTVVQPATPTMAARRETVNIRGATGVDVTVTGQAGQVFANSSGQSSAFSSTRTVSGITATLVQANDSRSTGGDVRATVGSSGRITTLDLFSSSGAAAVIVNGVIERDTGPGFALGDGSVSATSTGGDSTNRQTNLSDAITGFPISQTSTGANTNVGKGALIEVGAGGRVEGSATARSNAGAATVRVAGVVGTPNFGGGASATSTGVNTSSQRSSANRLDGSSESSGSGNTSLSGGAALVLVTTTGDAGGATANGDASASIDNAGRIRGGVFATSGSFTLTTAESSNQTRTVTNGAAGARTVVDQATSNRTTETLGGTASVTNAMTGVIGANVQVSGVRGATIDNAGTIASSINVNSFGSRSVSVDTSRATTTTTPAGGGVLTSTTREDSNVTNTRSSGGPATGTYSGTVGVARPLTPEGFSAFSSINQNAATASVATITGTVYANFAGNAGGTTVDSRNSNASRFVSQPTGAYTRDQSNASALTITQNASSSTLSLGPNGVLANNGSGTGSVDLGSSGGDAAFTLDAGRVDGSVNVRASTGFNTVRTSDTAASFTRGASQPNTFVDDVQQSQTNNSSFDQRAARGTATAMMNSGTIGGDLYLSGTGVGAGTLAVNALVNGTVAGQLTATADAQDSRNTTTDVATRTGPTTVTRTQTNSFVTTPAAESGNVLVAVNGSVGGGIDASAGGGSATVNLAGRAGTTSPNGVSVFAGDFVSQGSQSQTSISSNFFSTFPVVSSRNSGSSVPTGGAATLNVAPGAAVRATGASSIEGDIFVQGFAGSTLNVGAGARVVQNVGTVFVGGNFNTTAFEINPVLMNGVQTGSTGTSSGRFVGGPAILTNAGIIGSATNAATVVVASVGGATVANAGTVYGSMIADARGASRTTGTTTTDSNNFLLRRTVTNNVVTAAGGAATVDNSGLAMGGVTVIGAIGNVTNGGVVRGAVTLGGSFVNFNTTVTTTANTVNGGPVSTTTSTPAAALFTQNYRLDQNGLLVGGVNVTGATTIDPSGATTRTSTVNATVNLNNGSITLGNIAATANTNANVNLNGSGFLGVAASDVSTNLAPGQIVTGFVPTPSLTRFFAIDPALGVTVPLPSGSRISGVQTVTKAGDGTFVIVGAPVLPATGTTAAVNTLDVGALRVTGGELQLGLAGVTATANIFGVRGNVDNSASLVVGRRITDGTQTAVRGINVAVGGNLNNTPAGSLVVGVNPSFVRPNAAAAFVPFGQTPSIASTNSFVRVDGNLTLAGTVAVQAPTGGIYEAGRAYDLFSVGGAYSNTGTVRSTLASPFINFTLIPRSEGGRTIVSLDVARVNYDTVATDRNSAAVAQALQASVPGVVAGVRNGSSGSQDLASIIAALDTQFTAAQSAEAFRQLSSGEFYGSLAAISTTVPFGEATDGLSPGDGPSGVGLWFRPTGQFATYEENGRAGPSAIDLSNYGGSIGVDYATGAGGHFGVAGGYGALVVRAAGTPERAEAKTYMVGGYASQQLDDLHVSAQAVYGWSDWDVRRGLPLFGRTATSSFKSTELRASLRVAYAIELDTRFDLTPFVRGEARYFRFNGFDEVGAGSIGLSVGRRSKTVFNPEVGLRLAGATDDTNRVRPFAEGSYVFQGNPGTDRRMSLLGNPGAVFNLEGVLPGDAIKAAIGVDAGVGASTVFVRADYASGGRQQVGSVRGGVLLKF